MITKYCTYDIDGKCFCQLSCSHRHEVDLETCDKCKEYIPDIEFDSDDERVKFYRGEWNGRERKIRVSRKANSKD
jgi:hypothetical protein